MLKFTTRGRATVESISAPSLVLAVPRPRLLYPEASRHLLACLRPILDSLTCLILAAHSPPECHLAWTSWGEQPLTRTVDRTWAILPWTPTINMAAISHHRHPKASRTLHHPGIQMIAARIVTSPELPQSTVLLGLGMTPLRRTTQPTFPETRRIQQWDPRDPQHP